MSAKEERGSISSLAPDPRKQEIMSDDSDIEEVGRKIAPITSRHQRMETGDKARPGGTEDHSRILSSSFNWGPTANFTSTLDIEAIKVSIMCCATHLSVPILVCQLFLEKGSFLDQK